MGKSGFDLKKILSNKNTVTVLAVLLGVVVLYVAYNYRVKQAIKPISVPCANKAIPANTVITEDMIEYVEITSNLNNKSPNLITDASMLINKKVATGTSVPMHGLFYTDQIVDSSESYDSEFADIPDGYTIFALPVDINSTYGNSIYPGNYIDLYFKAETDDDKLIYGKFIESIKVLDVRDSSGLHVFDGGENMGQPAALLFAVPDDLHLLLTRAQLLEDSNVEIYPVPRNASYSQGDKETTVKSEFIRTFIMAKSATIPGEND